MIKHKRKYCEICGSPVYKTTAKVCSVVCALQYNLDHPDEIKPYFQMKDKKEERRKDQERKEKAKTHKDWLKDYERVFNEFIRTRDQGQGCISCGTKAKVEYHAGHYYPTTYSYLRFNEYNVNLQCGNNCNRMKGGNFHEYTIGLVKKYGQAVVDRLTLDRHKKVKLSIPEIKEKILEYKMKIKELKELKAA